MGSLRVQTVLQEQIIDFTSQEVSNLYGPKSNENYSLENGITIQLQEKFQIKIWGHLF